MQIVRPTAFPLRDAYRFAHSHGLDSESEAIKEKDIEWNKSYNSSVRRGAMIELLTNHGLLSSFLDQAWPSGRQPSGERLQQRYLRIWHEYQRFETGESDGAGIEEEIDSEVDERLAFPFESQLRDFLAHNLDRIEPGLRLYEKDGRKGVEYPVSGGAGRIDILAVDSSDRLVVIELKLSRGREKTLGQLLFYMGWVDQNLPCGKCRGAIIANEITDELKIAVSRVPDVLIARYTMTFAVEPVG